MNDRDEFASAAMQAIIGVMGEDAPPEQVAELAFGFANAMMKRRYLGGQTAVADLPMNAA